MALNNTTADALGAAIASAVAALTDEQKQDLPTVWKTIMRLVYSSLKSDAVVSVTSVSGVTSGGSSSGPGAGTLT